MRPNDRAPRIRRPKRQAHPLGWKKIKEFIDGAGEGLRADCERALLCVAYETRARRGELVALEVKDIDFHPNGTGHALIRRGKSDAGMARAAAATGRDELVSEER
jgi:integrase